jgi:predicted RNA-binding Zn-ribbon protein involved in translation (DUF1610 family)
VSAWWEARYSRGELRRAGEDVDRKPEVRAELTALLEARGEPPDVLAAATGLQLLRWARARGEASMEVSTPTARDEAFQCAFCGFDVPPAERTARDHCPRCLASLHVDVVPGDRAAGCGGRMDPVGGVVRGDEVILRYRCRKCKFERNMRALRRGPVPDDWVAVIAALKPGA